MHGLHPACCLPHDFCTSQAGTRSPGHPKQRLDCDEIVAPSCVWQSLSPDLPGPPDHPARKESLTFRFGLSTLVSMMTTDCQVPSSIRPSSTGIVSDGLMNAGSTWSRP